MTLLLGRGDLYEGCDLRQGNIWKHDFLKNGWLEFEAGQDHPPTGINCEKTSSKTGAFCFVLFLMESHFYIDCPDLGNFSGCHHLIWYRCVIRNPGIACIF